MSEEKKSGLAKAASTLAAVLVISLGLCGVNFVVAISGNNYPGGLLMSTGFLELLGMTVGSVGLIGVGLTTIVRKIRATSSMQGSDPDSIIEKDEEK
jgi:hypothetical protein